MGKKNRKKKPCPVSTRKGRHDPTAFEDCTCPIPYSDDNGKDRLDRFLTKFKKIIDEEREKYGAEYIRGKRQGGVLHALVSGHRIIPPRSTCYCDEDVPF